MGVEFCQMLFLCLLRWLYDSSTLLIWCVILINLPILSHLCISQSVSSITQSGPTLCDPKDCSTPGFLIHHQLPELAQTHVLWVGDAIQPSLLSTDRSLDDLWTRLCVCAKSLQSCPTLCDPMDCRPPGSSVYGILQARILEWVAMPSSKGSSQPRDRTHVS